MLFSLILIIISLIAGFNTIGGHSRYCYDGQVMSDPKSCTKYQVCRNGRYVERNCNFGVWNESTKKCEFSIQLCRARTDRAWHRLVLPDCNTSANRNHAFRHPFDCSKYFTCDKSGVVENVCDEGLSFNQNSESCMPESNCETMKPIFSSGRKSQPELEQVRRRHNVQNDCDNKVDEFDETVEKSPTPSVRKHAYFYDDDYDENNEEDVDNLESYEK